MSELPAPQWKLDPAVLALLACPACHSKLKAEAERLSCVACGQIYPVVDGIPVLIAATPSLQR